MPSIDRFLKRSHPFDSLSLWWHHIPTWRPENPAPSGTWKGQWAHMMCWCRCRAQGFITSHFQWPCTLTGGSHTEVPLAFPRMLEWRAPAGLCNVTDNISDRIFLASTFKLSRLLSVQSRLSFLWSHYITTSFVFHIYQKLPTWKQFTGGWSR